MEPDKSEQVVASDPKNEPIIEPVIEPVKPAQEPKGEPARQEENKEPRAAARDPTEGLCNECIVRELNLRTRSREWNSRGTLWFSFLIFCFLVSLSKALGVGTIIMSAMGPQLNGTQCVIGILQFVLCWTIVCWVWSIIWGVLIFQKCKAKLNQPKILHIGLLLSDLKEIMNQQPYSKLFCVLRNRQPYALKYLWCSGEQKINDYLE